MYRIDLKDVHRSWACFVLNIIMVVCITSISAFGQKEHLLWHVGDTSKLNDFQVKYLLNKCFENLWMGNSFIRNNGMTSIGVYIDNEAQKDIFFTFSYGSTEAILKEFERFHYIDYSHVQIIKDQVKSFNPTFKVDIIYSEGDIESFPMQNNAIHVGHIQVSDLLLHRDMIYILYDVLFYVNEEPCTIKTKNITKFCTYRWDNGEVFLHSVQNTDNLTYLEPLNLTPQVDPIIIYPKYLSPNRGPRIINNKVLPIKSEY
jgi:hypothetical protein